MRMIQLHGGHSPARAEVAAREPVDRTRASLRGMAGFEAQARALDPNTAAAVQLDGPGRGDAAHVQQAAAHGTAGSGGSLPHLERIQASFGGHDVGAVQAHVGGAAAQACGEMGASAYATGNQVAFQGAPDLHTAAHEAAHVVQQRAGVSLKGGVGQAGDGYEQHADAVADAVVQGKSAEPLLDKMAGRGGGAGGEVQQRAAPVQMYARVPARRQREGQWNAGEDLRVADDGRIAVPEGESKRMFATPGIIREAAQVMENQGSMYTVAAGAQTIKGEVPNARGSTRTLVEVIPTNLKTGDVGEDVATTEACSTHGQEIMGAGARQGVHPHAAGVEAVVGGEGRRWDRTRIGNDLGIVHALRDEVSGHQRAQTHTGDERRAEDRRSERSYERMGKGRRNERAQQLGINQHAVPEVGEGIAVYNVVSRLLKGYPMHFAAVIAKSGGDYVTFENYAKDEPERGGKNPRAPGDTIDASKAWYFRMYGPAKRGDDQSFYGEYVKLGEQGGKDGTLVMKHRKVGGFANDTIIEAERCRKVWERFAVTGMDRNDTPQFYNAYNAFTRLFTAVKDDAKGAWMRDEAPPEARFEELETCMEVCKQTEIGAALLVNPDPRLAPPVEKEVLAQRQQPAALPVALQDEDGEDEDAKSLRGSQS